MATQYNEQSAPQAVAALLEEIRELMALKGENPFKIRAFEKAAGTIGSHTDLLARAREGTLVELPGIGKGIAEVIREFLIEGKSSERDQLKASLPEGLMELTQVPGLGPKKAMKVIEELGIKTLGELEYACRENRLLKLDGFGEKIQAKILSSLLFLRGTQGQKLLSEALSDTATLTEALSQQLHRISKSATLTETGPLRRRCETLAGIDFLISRPKSDSQKIDEALAEAAKKLAQKHSTLPVTLHFCEPDFLGYELVRTSGTKEHWKKLGEPKPQSARSEEEFYKNSRLPVIYAEARETGEEVTLAKSGKLPEALLPCDVQGIFHNHTTASDGTATLEQMVAEAKRLGFKYIGISDHSQSAFYAQGLKTDALKNQEKQIRELQEKYPEIRIFWGIESDILADGKLDYDAKTLSRFDFVIASIHSRFGMDKKAMTERLVEAIRHPQTRFIGHLTGRLLLGRPGYEIDFEKIIAEASKHDVAIELNSHPSRLDIDWRHGPQLREYQTFISINPDAHSLEGLSDTQYGVFMARKALLSKKQIVNTRSSAEVAQWLARK